MIAAGTGMPIVQVNDAAALIAAVDACRAKSAVALDTEFMRVRTFYAQAALFQLCDGVSCYLVDPLAVGDLEPLAALLRDPAVTKLMHSCSEDLEICERRLGALPEPLLDTQIMAAFCGLGLSIGYQRALGELLELKLEKSETRTDWLQRPLTEAQLRYAADDVAYLGALHEALERRFADCPERLDWVREECAGVLLRFRARDSSADYRVIGGAWKLDPRALGVLRAVHAWRESHARSRDLPRNWVLPDAALMRLAEQRPRDAHALSRVADIPGGVLRRHGEALLAVVADALALPPAQLPEPVLPPPGPAEARQVKQLREYVVGVGERLGIAPELLARRRELEELLRLSSERGGLDGMQPMSGWRGALVGDGLRQMLGGGS